MSDHETCETCGAVLSIGDYPFCGGKNNHGRYGGTEVPDSFGGAGMWIENLDASPVWVESKTQLHREAKKRGLRWEPKESRRTPIDDVRGRFNGGAYPTYRT